MVTEYPMDKPNGSTLRVKWELDALGRQGFSDISLIDNYGKKSTKPVNCIIHAQQLSGRFFDKKTYISDLHGIAFEEMWHRSFKYPFYSWKRWGFRTKSHYIKKLENMVYKNALHVICASDSIYEIVKHIQSATVVRNAIKIDEYLPTTCDTLKVAVVGPFLPGTQNYEALELIHYCVKNIEKIEFIFIGSVDKNYREKLRFPNVKFLGRVDNFIETLSGCSVLLSPYPEYSYILASKNKMLEAGGCQIAVVTTESGALGFPDDFFIIGKSKQDFVEKLLYLEDEKARKDYGKKLRSEIERNYNADTEVKKLIKLYDEFID